MNYHSTVTLAMSVIVLACGGPTRSSVDPSPAQTATFCAPAPDPASQPSEGPVHFPDTLRIVGDSRDNRLRRRPEADTAGAFVTSRPWFRERDRLTFGSTSYFVWGPVVVAHGVTNAEDGEVWVKYRTYDGVPLYGLAQEMPEPSRLLAPEGLPCRLVPYVHEETLM